VYKKLIKISVYDIDIIPKNPKAPCTEIT